MPGIEWLLTLTNHEKRPPSKYTGVAYSTEHYIQILERLGNPHISCNTTVQLLGTDGKGSTLAFLETLLLAARKQVCSFISPHLIRVEERFRENGLPVATAVLEAHLDAVRTAVGGLEELTYFEALNAAFWLWVRESEPDIVLLETGLGGRLDTTTVCRPKLKILTLLDRDHFPLLGKTVPQIAREKLAALVPGVPTIVGKQSPFLCESIQGYLEANRITAIWTEEAAGWVVREGNRHSWEIRLGTRHLPPRIYRLGLLGDHQVANFATALCAFETLGFALGNPEDPIVISPNWQGRCQVISDRDGRNWVLDGSHTAMSGQALAAVLDRVFPRDPRTFFVASSRDRFPWCYLRGLVRREDKLVLVDYNHPRLWRDGELRIALEQEGWNGFGTPSLSCLPAEAVFSQPEAEEGLSILCGSLYWVGEGLRRLTAGGATNQPTLPSLK
jgi:dihydrofolate synthase/folylpolyglutamate synthase